MTRLVQISDLHFGADDPVLIQAFLETLEAAPPDVVVITGDVTQAGRAREFKRFGAFLDEVQPAVVAVPGNHDSPVFEPVRRLLAPYARFHDAVEERARATYADETVLVYGLNTARAIQARFDWSLGVVAARDIINVEATLEAAPPGVVTILACHHPLVTPPGAPFPARTIRGEAAAERFAAFGVDLVMSGHMHVPAVGALAAGDGRTVAVGCGTTFSVRRRGAPASFNVLEIDAGAVTVRTMNWRDNAFQEHAAQVFSLRTRNAS